MSTQEMLMENQQNKVCYTFLKLKRTCIYNFIILRFSLLQLFMNYWVMVLVSYMISFLRFILLLMVNLSQLTTSLMRLGIVFLVKLLQLTRNVKLIVQLYIFHYLKVFKKIFCLSIAKNKDGILFMLLGTILLWVALKVYNTMMPNITNGFKLILEHHMLS